MHTDFSKKLLEKTTHALHTHEKTGGGTLGKIHTSESMRVNLQAEACTGQGHARAASTAQM